MPDLFFNNILSENEKKWREIKDPRTCHFPDKPKIINDSIYGTIKLSRELVFLMDLPCFQRLRRIKQLGFNNFVYPGANHTRFEHSIGAAYLMNEFLTNLLSNSSINLR